MMRVSVVTDAPASLAEALLIMQRDLPTVAKRQTATTATYSYKYAGLSSVMSALLPRLNRLGLLFVARPLMSEGKFILACELLHVATGEKLVAEYPITAAANAPAQAIGSAISYGRRYSLCAMVGLVAEEDDDGRAASARYDEPEPPRRERAPRPPKGISEPQLRKIMALMNQAGMVEREQRLRYCSEVAGRPLSSSNDLTQQEAGQVIETLEQAQADNHNDQNPDGGTA
jgi:hypothetical protein